MSYPNEIVLPFLDGEYVECGPARRSKININLFDRDGKCLAARFDPGYARSCYKHFVERILSAPNCFTISIRNYGVPTGVEVIHYHYFETLFVTQYKCSGNGAEFGPCQPYEHSLTREILYTLKHFQLSLGNWSSSGYSPIGYELHRLRPELFKTKSPEKVNFEEKVKQNQAKFEAKFEETEKVLQKLQVDLQKVKDEESNLLEEKKKLFKVKQKLDLMKQELEREREAFEKEKREHEIQTIDLDDYFELPVAHLLPNTIQSKSSYSETTIIRRS